MDDSVQIGISPILPDGWCGDMVVESTLTLVGKGQSESDTQFEGTLGDSKCETHDCEQPQICQNKCKKCYNTHYRKNHHLNIDALELLLRTPACVIMGCGGARYCQGMCHRCYYSEYRRQQREKNTLCFVAECHRWPSVGLLCRFHHDQKRRGELAIELPPRERKTRNKSKTKKREREEATEAISDLPPMKKMRKPDE
jgi:hypothetical protein